MLSGVNVFEISDIQEMKVGPRYPGVQNDVT